MIQRIQTVCLFIVSGLFFALLFLPLAFIPSGDIHYIFQVAGLETTDAGRLLYAAWPLLTIDIIIILLSLISIFLYKRRILQKRICVYNMLLMIGFCLMIGFYFVKFNHDVNNGMSPDLTDLKIWAFFPLIALGLIILAIRKISADEAMVRSLNRLR